MNWICDFPCLFLFVYVCVCVRTDYSAYNFSLYLAFVNNVIKKDKSIFIDPII